MTDAAENLPIRDRFRIRFAKIGLLRWIGHRDLQRLWERLLRRAGLRLSMTQGFHPKPRISFPSALALGVEGLDEVVEIELNQRIEAEELHQRLFADHQPGLEIGSVRLVARFNGDGTAVDSFTSAAKAKLHSSQYEITIPDSFDIGRIDAALVRASDIGAITIARKDKQVTAELATTFPRLQRAGRTLQLTHVDTPGPTLKPTDLLDAIGLEDLTEHGAIIRRTKVLLADEVQQSQTTPTTRACSLSD
jgi:radical SAM-linked protein